MLIDLIERAKKVAGSNEKLAKMLKTKPSTVSEWKSKVRKPNPWQICYMADIAGLNVADTLFQVLKNLDTEHAEAFEIWRPYGDSNPGYRRERAMS